MNLPLILVLNPLNLIFKANFKDLQFGDKNVLFGPEIILSFRNYQQNLLSHKSIGRN